MKIISLFHSCALSIEQPHVTENSFYNETIEINFTERTVHDIDIDSQTKKVLDTSFCWFCQ